MTKVGGVLTENRIGPWFDILYMYIHKINKDKNIHFIIYVTLMSLSVTSYCTKKLYKIQERNNEIHRNTEYIDGIRTQSAFSIFCSGHFANGDMQTNTVMSTVVTWLLHTGVRVSSVYVMTVEYLCYRYIFNYFDAEH